MVSLDRRALVDFSRSPARARMEGQGSRTKSVALDPWLVVLRTKFPVLRTSRFALGAPGSVVALGTSYRVRDTESPPLSAKDEV